MSLMAHNILNGFNENEVLIVQKIGKNWVFLKIFSTIQLKLFFLVIFIVFIVFNFHLKKYSCHI